MFLPILHKQELFCISQSTVNIAEELSVPEVICGKGLTVISVSIGKKAAALP
jgi:hypothetical protein